MMGGPHGRTPAPRGSPRTRSSFTPSSLSAATPPACPPPGCSSCRATHPPPGPEIPAAAPPCAPGSPLTTPGAPPPRRSSPPDRRPGGKVPVCGSGRLKRPPAGSGRPRRAVIARDVQLPRAQPRALRVASRRSRAEPRASTALALAREQRPDVDAVERLRRQRRAGKPGHRGSRSIEVEATPSLHRARPDAAGQARDKRLAHAAFERLPLAAAQPPRASLVPRPVVAREHHQRVLVQPVLAEARSTSPTLQSSSATASPYGPERRLAAEALRRAPAGCAACPAPGTERTACPSSA